MVGNRRRARESALQLLYQDEFHGPGDAAIAERAYWQAPERAADKKEIRAFASVLLTGVREQLVAIDERIRSVARNWKIERMSRVDRNILRIAAFELLFADDIPPKASMNEAIEIAKSFGTEDSGAFINGILDRIARDVSRARNAALLKSGPDTASAEGPPWAPEDGP